MRGFAKADSTSAFHLMKAMHLTFRFRHLHWTMVKQYIINNTKHPVATGGTPITTWLPNNMGACLEYCQDLMAVIKPDEMSADDKAEYLALKETVEKEIDSLFKEVLMLQNDGFDQNEQQISDFSTRTQ